MIDPRTGMPAATKFYSVTVQAERLPDAEIYDFYNQSNIVDVYVDYLRPKIDDGRPLQLIRTVRGAGYKLSADA